MAKQRYINTRFWDDSYISNLDPSEKLVFLYLLTNPATSICGVYEIPLKRIASDTGFDKEMVVKILDRFGRDKKILYRDGWVIVVNFQKHQNVGSDQIKKGIAAEMADIPQHIKEELEGIQALSYLNLNSNLNLDSNSDLIKAELPEAPAAQDAEALSCTQYLYDQIKEHTNPPVWNTKPPKLDGWYKDIEALHRIDGISYADMRQVMGFCTHDQFWSTNIMSGKKFREQYNRLYAQMTRPRKGGAKPNVVTFDPKARLEELKRQRGEA